MAWLLFGRAPSGIIHDTKPRLQKPPSRHRAVTTAARLVTLLDVSRTVTGIEDLKPFGPLVVTHGSGVCWLQPSQPENSTAKTGSGKIPENRSLRVSFPPSIGSVPRWESFNRFSAVPYGKTRIARPSFGHRSGLTVAFVLSVFTWT